ncbi:MAG: VCBS repeat-containing protein, partial [Bacteroidetes bacterium]|nr:VCBS repeat-containing protein [Bacteroidota bacterium]
VVLDMVAEDNYRQKTMMSSMNTELFWSYVDYGWHYQYMRNSFQINNGNGYFSEVGQLAGISNTDWSWAVLLADFDNDGLKDMFISNGYRRDGRNVDYRNKLAEMEKEQGGVFRESQIDELLAMIPSEKLTNYFYKNIGDLAFEKKSQDYGFVTPSFSNGAAYADFDNDGDLDLVVNNLTDPAFIYRNNAIEELQNNYLRIELVGLSPNKHGIGASATLYVDGQIQYLEAYVSRGYQSCVESTLHFGLGDNTKVDELLIKWPDGTEQLLVNIGANRVIKVFQKDAVEPDNSNKIETTQLFADITTQTGVNYRHIENEFDDFLKETLLPHKMSQFGPKIASGDVNGDGYEDFYIGGAAGQTGALYINNGNSSFSHSTRQPFDSEKQCEDIGSLFFDADGDGDLDLYVVSGGNEFAVGSTDLQDRLYLNDGAGNFTRAENVLPEMFTSGSCVVANDYDNDGDLDLFVGGRLVPGRYTFAPRSYLLNNENGIFKDVTEEVAIGLLRPGMVTSAVWTDFDGDNDQDLIVVGEWMPLSFYENKEGRFEDITFDLGMENTTGWWNKIVSSDFDNDGDDDYVIGNLGLNYKYKATENEPLHVYCHDFDNSGSLDIVLGYYNYGECFPVRGRECSSNQMPFIKDKFKNYDAFGKATLEDVYGDALQSALQHHEAKMFESIYIINEGNNKFKLLPLPIEAQVSMVFGIIIEDFNGDGNEDVLLAGNFYVSEVETGRADAGIGLYLKGNGKGNFTPVKVRESGFFADRDVRDLALIKNYDDSGYSILVANNNDKMQIFLNGSLPGQNIVSVK